MNVKDEFASASGDWHGTSPDIHLKTGVCPAWGQALCQAALVQALSGLTGIKATIPVAMIAWWSLISDDTCPFALGPGGEWLGTWWACGIFSAAVIVEIVADCVPALDSSLDTVMLFVKPVIAFIIATAPYYDSSWTMYCMQLAGPALGLAMALAKAFYTLVLDAGSCGCCAPIRSIAESMSVFVIAIFVLLSAIISMVVALGCMAVAICAFRWYRQRQYARECGMQAGSVHPDPALPSAPPLPGVAVAPVAGVVQQPAPVTCHNNIVTAV